MLPWRLALDIGTPMLTLALAWMSIQNNSRRWFVVALLVALILALIQVGLRWTAAAAERRIREQTSAVMDYLIGEIDRASQLEQRIRGDANATARFEHYRDQVEAWRTETGHELERRLPRRGGAGLPRRARPDGRRAAVLGVHPAPVLPGGARQSPGVGGLLRAARQRPTRLISLRP
jgi:hypothetical protein